MDLTSNPAFPNTPTLETLEPIFEAPTDWGDNYGQRMRALFVPPQTGTYVFWIASDDNGALYLSTDETPAKKSLIATVNGWTSSREWLKEPNQQSAGIRLTNGFRYYIEALSKEGGGGDNLAVRVQLPDGSIDAPISNQRLLAYGLGPPIITRQPTNTSVLEQGTASFSVALDHMLGTQFQWVRNGTAMPGATNPLITLTDLTLSQSGQQFRCLITNSYGSTQTVAAVLTVIPDTTPPTVSTVGSLGESQIVFVVFSEPVQAAGATNIANYQLSNGATVTRATFGTDNRTIILTTSPLSDAVNYQLTVNNILDLASTPNIIAANTRKTFSLSIRPVDAAYHVLTRERIGPSSRRHGVVISEVMYHPTNRVDGRNLEFIELYNSQPWPEELGGWRISGAIDYTFPTNVVLGSRAFLVVAAKPLDFKSVYTFTNVFGPFANSNSLQNGSGTLRLRNRRDAVLFEMDYTGDPPYPAGADGAGHSLVLARPSYGERDPRAWAQSDLVGGNPGAADTASSHGFRSIVINEVLAHTDPPEVDYIELFNSGPALVNLGGCILTDDPSTNKFLIPANTTLGSRQWLAFTQTQLGFALSAAGETVFLKSPDGARVIDSIRFKAQENGVAWGRYPDGAQTFSRLSAVTLGTKNADMRPRQVVINELMYDPPSGDSADEFIELHNPGTQPVDVGGWKLRDAVSYTIPSGTQLSPGGYLVIAKDLIHMRSNYPGLSAAITLGNYGGTLANGGERLELTMPDEIASTNSSGVLVTNRIHIPVDEVSYKSGGRWGRWSGGGGSSLELRDPRSDGRLAPNWADSDETGKSAWVTVEATGVMDNGWADATQLHITLLGAGEALIDNVEVIPAGGANVIQNGTFESGTGGWVFQGNHRESGLETSQGFGSARSLRIRASGRGDSGSNRIRTQLPSTLAPGTTVTLRVKARWLKGNPNLLLRLRGNWLEAPGYLLTAKNLGTPGAANSSKVPNAGPAITSVRHDPPLPPAGQGVIVSARVSDPDGLAFLALNYRIDPTNTYRTVAMTNHGGGLYSAAIPAQAAGASASFYIRAMDNSSPSAQSTFPDDAPNREGVVRWGDNSVPGSLPIYHIWASETNVSRWKADERMSNQPKDVTFVYGTNRIVYNAGAWFHGSPYHSPGYDSPVGVSCDYDMGFPADDLLLGETDISLFRPGNGGGDGTGQAEIQGYWFGDQLGIPFLYHRPVFVFVNGQRRETIFHDAQQPNGDYIRQWFPNDTDGDLHKIQLGFEFGDQAYGASEPGYSVVGADFNRRTTTGGVMKQAYYRATLPLRSASPTQQNDYTNLFSLIDTVLTPAPLNTDAYTATLMNAVDVEQWYRVHVTQHLINNPDSFSYGGGQNAFLYSPQQDTWKLFLWDIDFAFGGDPNDGNLFGIGGPEHGPRNDHAPFTRIYWQVLMEAADGMLTAARSNPILDARYNGMTASGAGVGSPQGIKDFIATRRNVVLAQIAANQSAFSITSNAGADFSTNRNLITLTGTAPLQVRTLLINGIPYPTTWTSVSTWVIRIPLKAGVNALTITGIDLKGNPVSAVNKVIRINYTGVDESPVGRVVINEIMYHPAVTDGSYIEILNTSASNAFDLSGWRLDGASFTFPLGTIIEPGAYLVIAKDKAVFAATYGALIPVLAEFSGQLDNGGETLSLIKPGLTPAQDLVIDRVTYDDNPPWPASADGLGSSLQLVDAAQDHNRSANWKAAESNVARPPQVLIQITNVWKYNATQDLTLSNWTSPSFDDSAWPSGPGLLYNETAALPGPKNTPLTLGRLTYYFRTHFTHVGSPSGASLSLNTIIDDAVVLYLNGKMLFPLGIDPNGITYSTLSARGVGDAVLEGPFILSGADLLPGDNVLTAEVHQSSASSSDIVFGLSLETTYTTLAATTPGAANSVRSTLPPFPPLWLNEILPNNLFLGTDGVVDHLGEKDPWLELYNGGDQDLSLNDYFLANNYTNLTAWAFPSTSIIKARGFLRVWLDGQTAQALPNELHANFRAAPAVGSVVLSRGAAAPMIVDHLNYRVPVAGHSYGSYPDGAVSGRRTFVVVTPNATNNPASAPITVYINEWMADNTTTLADPADGRFDDWFELYNPGNSVVDLTGCFLSDTTTNTTHWAIPEGTTIPARGYLLVWADNSPGQNDATRPDLHAGFSLAKGGESITLFSSGGKIIDSITYGPQTTDVSQGRFQDGAATLFSMTSPTPRRANLIQVPNTPPVLTAIGNRVVDEGALLSFGCSASDTNVPAQKLTFTLDAGAPSGAALDPNTGRFTWTPTEAQGPGVYPITVRVTDDGAPPMEDSETIQITVHEVNSPPILTPLNSRTVPEGGLLTVANTAVDPDSGNTVLTYSLDAGYPAGMTLDSKTGELRWTPTEEQGPGTYTVTIRVTDNGEPPLSSSQPLTLFVTEVNEPPTLNLPASLLAQAGVAATFKASATDPDRPAQGLHFSLDAGAPATAEIDANTGVFNWIPSDAEIGIHSISVRVEDTGSPRLSQSKVISIEVAGALKITATTENGQALIRFASLPGKRYRVEFKNRLEEAEWKLLGSEQIATATETTVADPILNGEGRFYRVLRVE